jgi:flagellar hook assembly protein FlgD
MLAIYPNPSTGQTTVVFRVAASQAEVGLSVYDVAGRRVASIVEGPFAQGEWSTTWDGRSRATGDPLPQGIYFVRLESRGENHTEKLILVR